jgi:hypothetical protein
MRGTRYLSLIVTAFTTRIQEIYVISRVTFNAGVIDLMIVYHHKLKREIIMDPLQAYDESSIITI